MIYTCKIKTSLYIINNFTVWLPDIKAKDTVLFVFEMKSIIVSFTNGQNTE